jgi:hypothetical protein
VFDPTIVNLARGRSRRVPPLGRHLSTAMPRNEK